MRTSTVRIEHGFYLNEHRFEKGDILPVHAHSADVTTHVTFITRGAFRVLPEESVLRIGDVAAWNPGEPHGFEALEESSVLLNVRKAFRHEIDPDYKVGQEGDPEPEEPPS